jgi:glutaminase
MKKTLGGDSNEKFSIQSISKALTVCIAFFG